MRGILPGQKTVRTSKIKSANRRVKKSEKFLILLAHPSEVEPEAF
jgi:hypothetical protein